MDDFPGVRVTLIALVSSDGYISKGRGVPWDIPADREHFRTYTAGRWLLLGRRTFEEMTGWFCDHVPLVLSRDPSFVPEIGHRVSEISEAIVRSEAAGQDELVVCGGGQTYMAAIGFAQKLVISRVDRALGGGVAFPRYEMDPTWHLMSSEAHQGTLSFSINVHEREHPALTA